MLIKVIQALVGYPLTQSSDNSFKDGYKVDLMSICTISDHYNYAKTKVH